MINVLHIHTLPIISGSGINTFLSMRGMDKSLYAVELAVAPGGPLIELVGQHGIKVHSFKHFVQPLDPFKDLLALLDLYVFLRRKSYHVIHTHNSKAGFIGRLAGKWARVPVIVHTVHGFAFHNQEPPWRQALFRNLERLAAHWCDKMIFISQPLIDWAFREGITRNSKVVKVYSGIELDHFRPVSAEEKKRIRKKWGIGPRDSVIGIVSKLWEGKGHATLIHAFREIKKEMARAKLVIVGEGYLYEDLVALVDRLGLEDSVLFTGFQMDVFEIIATFDVAVLPSFFEGMGRVLLEAMAMEKPVVASRVGGIPELVEDGVNGFLVNPGKIQELKEGLLRVLRDKKLARKLGRQGRKKTTDRFSAEIMIQSIDEIYRELLSAKGISLYA
jgi:glycosyltransferase involved in cell wall biosynthesis